MIAVSAAKLSPPDAGEAPPEAFPEADAVVEVDAVLVAEVLRDDDDELPGFAVLVWVVELEEPDCPVVVSV